MKSPALTCFLSYYPAYLSWIIIVLIKPAIQVSSNQIAGEQNIDAFDDVCFCNCIPVFTKQVSFTDLNLQQSLNDVKTFACMTSPQKTQCESCIQVSFFFCCVAPVCFLSDQRAILRTSLNESIIFFFQGFGLVDDERC